MIIHASNIQLAQSHHSQQLIESQTRQRAQITANDAPPDAPRRLITETHSRFDYLQQHQERFRSQSQITHADGREQQHSHHQSLEALTRLHLSGHHAQAAAIRAFPVANQADASGKGLELSGEVGFELTHQMQMQSEQSSQMAAQGNITLEDGRRIRFDLFMQHQTQTQLHAISQTQLSLATFQDPLVINFGSERTHLTDQVFEFDLNSDGQNQSLASLGRGSGYLALDLNDDGQINDGQELFGPQSGNGFTDLAQYDADGNGWIDEQDPIFDQLKLWMPQQGEQDGALVSLSDKGVGAIYLQQVAQARTHFSEEGETLGQTHAGGLVLMESGEVKTAEAIDLAERQTDGQASHPPARDRLQEMADAFNERQREWETRFAALWGPAPERGTANGVAQPGDKASDKVSETRDFFERLQAQIEQIVAQRKALLERVEQRYQT
ncbi:hypothetical protein [Hydrogenovibrio halophilus]|uniref:hypothetical protein n=1 Tax=Hydrogenovibrio halophilus TaxID=373391 RepID=UPI00037E8292|nr:hypothetical protein [Hydrogenovibrio halophilus]